MNKIMITNMQQTEKLASIIAKNLPKQINIYLSGDLGAGKTTLVAFILSKLGFNGIVKSPTYSIVEEYQLDFSKVFHFDLYRLAHPEELEFIGIREYLSCTAIRLFEWPEQGIGILPDSDVAFKITVEGQNRHIKMDATSSIGEKLIQRVFSDYSYN